ncbi:MAG: pentapeptide repeat-containing protein [Cyanobacteria bacterium J06554_6]
MVLSVTSKPETGPEKPIDLVSARPTVTVRLGVRRLGAWLAEAGLLAMTGLVPFGLGLAATRTSMTTVPLNPLLNNTQTQVANLLRLPKSSLRSTVPPLTNLLWTLGLIAPVGVGIWQEIQLSKTGQTLPKRWLRLRVVDHQGQPLGGSQLLIREGTRWGLPLAFTYAVGAASGVMLGPWLPVVVGIGYLGLGATAAFNRQRQPWYDRLARTQVVGIGAGDISQTYQVAPEDIFEPARRALPPVSLLYGADADIDEAIFVGGDDGGLSSLVLSPVGQSLQTVPPVNQRRLPLKTLSLVGLGGLVVGSVWGTQTYIQAQVDQRIGGWQSDKQFLSAVQTLIAAPENTTEYQAAILALAQISDPRAVDYLADLLTQTRSPEVLDTLQQALVGHGVSALPALRQLSQILASDLDMSAGDPDSTLRRQQQAVQQAITKILLLNDGNLVGARFDKVDLSYQPDAPAPFRLRVTEIDAAGTHWRGARLAHANFSGTRFSHAGTDGQIGTLDDLTSDFSGADLKGANLSQTNLRAAQLVRTSLLRADLSRSDVSQADLSHSNLSSARLLEANMGRSRLVESKLVGADLTRADFSRADLPRAQLNQVEAAETQWNQADLTETQWRDADLSGANFANADLTRASLLGSRLKQADLSGANLQGANLREADLEGATLTGANLEGTDFMGTRFSGDAAIASNSFITQTQEVETGNRLRGVNFSRAVNLSGQQLNYICAQGGIHPACRGVQPPSNP